MNVKEIEKALMTHLTESGEIRESIRNLKEAVDTLTNRMWAAMGFSIVTCMTVIGFLLKVTLWGN